MTEKVGKMSIRFERTLVTPALARKWLKQIHPNQRRPKNGKIPQYARDMQSGNWQEDTGETIKFDVDDLLIDGQNRLYAVDLADREVWMYVSYNHPATSMSVLDTGAARSAGDVLIMAGATNRSRMASIIRWTILWDAKIYTGRGGNVNPTHQEIVQRYQSMPDRYDTASQRGTDCMNRGLGTASATGTALYLFLQIDPEQAHAFFDQVIGGANLPELSPALALRNRLARRRIDRISTAEQLAVFVRAWNAFREDRTLSQIIITRDGNLTNLNFPQPR